MTQKKKLKMIATMAVIVAIALFSNSCSNDEFFGLDDDFEDDVYMFADNSYCEDVFLDIDYEGAMLYATEQEKRIYDMAYSRLTIVFENNQLIIKEKKGRDVNISERLYNRIKDNIEKTNEVFFTPQNNTLFRKAIRRKKNNNRETIEYNNKNCPCFAICYYKYGDLTQAHLMNINNILTEKYGDTYTNGDLAPDDIPDATGYCGNRAELVQELPIDQDMRALYCLESGVSNDTIIGHMYIIKKIENTSVSPAGSRFYNMFWMNPATGSDLGPTRIAPSGTLPITTPDGQHIIIPANSVYM